MAYRKTAATAARKNARRKLLLDAAIRLFGTYGYHAATVPMIVLDAGSSVGSFYAHFRNKEDLFAAVLAELSRKVAEVMQQAELSQPDPVLAIGCAVEALFLFLAENPMIARILIVESSGLSPRLEQIRRGNLEFHATNVCRKLQAAPETFCVLDPAIAARCLVGAVFEALTSWLQTNPNDRASAQQVARAVADYNSRAILRVQRDLAP